MQQVWINGVQVTSIPVTDRGLAYGDGLFETICVADGQMPLLERHLSRLSLGLRRLKFPADTLNAVKADIAALSLQGDLTLKLMVTRGSGARGYALPEPTETSRIIIISPRQAVLSPQQKNGIKSRFCDYQMAINPQLAGIKHLNRLEQVIARSEWQDTTINEGVLLDSDGFLVEGTMSNLFWVTTDGKVQTPALERCGVAGVMRGYLLDTLTALGIATEQGLYRREALLSATEIFFCNSLIHLWPVRELEGRAFAPGKVCRLLQQRIKQDLF
ncbi:aminodeoxychorismate lyase [Pontibacter sp. JAM-7]|uniref:aminodeoxychorismate lyase n=1 Tax=Pontibacter sp. JAM-7 TaxID=3366581 RepID=UPI003AF54BAC